MIIKGKIPSFIWTAKPSAAAFVGYARISDVGANGTEWYSDGTKWSRDAFTLYQKAIPVFIPSNGSIGNNGALTLTVAFATVYSAGCYLYFPANAIVAGSAAGLYYCVMSSTTVGTIYNNTYTTGIHTVPASPTPFVTTGPGAYTQTTNAYITLGTLSIPGGVLGSNGTAKITTDFHHAATTNSRTVRVTFDSNTLMSTGLTTAVATTVSTAMIRTQGSPSLVYSPGLILPAVGGGSSSNPELTYTIDTSQDKAVSLIGQLGTGIGGTDYIGIRGYEIVMQPS